MENKETSTQDINKNSKTTLTLEELSFIKDCIYDNLEYLDARDMSDMAYSMMDKLDLMMLEAKQ